MQYHLLLAVAAAMPGAQDGAATIDRLLACERVGDDAGRLDCYDAQARAIRAKRAEAVAAVEARRPVRPEFTPVDAAVRAVTPLRPGFWQVVLADGSVWRNDDWTGPVPRVGKAMTVRKGSLGSLWAKTEGVASVKVRRVR